MDVYLTPELERRIAERPESGVYASAREVVRESLRLMFETEESRNRQLARLRNGIQIGLDQLDRGEGLPAAHVFAEIAERLDGRRRQ